MPESGSDRLRPLASVLRPHPVPDRLLGISPRVTTYELRVTQKFFARMIEEALPDVIEGRFSVLIGDDTSGRVPALVARRVFNKALMKAGRNPLPLLFWQSTMRESQIETMRLALQRRRPHLDAVEAQQGRALIITEWIERGIHIGNMIDQLAEIGLGADVATLGMATYHHTRASYGPKLYNGGCRDANVYGLYRNLHVSGMNREKYTDEPVSHDPDIRQSKRVARTDALSMAAMIAHALGLDDVPDPGPMASAREQVAGLVQRIKGATAEPQAALE